MKFIKIQEGCYLQYVTRIFFQKKGFVKKTECLYIKKNNWWWWGGESKNVVGLFR